MEPPKWVSEEIERIHPRARVGWIGAPRVDEDVDGPNGFFMVLQLYHRRDAEHTLYQRWDKAGPIYGSDFDPLTWVPIIKFPVSPMDMCQGRVLPRLKEEMRPFRERILLAAQEDDAAYERQFDDLCSEIGEKLYHKACLGTADRGPDLARKFVDQDTKDILTGDVDLTAGDKSVDDLTAGAGQRMKMQ